MPKIILCEQGSDEWLEHRKGVATASNFGNIITPATSKESATLPKYAKKLALELLYEKTSESSFKSAAMQAGNDFEGLARQMYQEEAWNIVKTTLLDETGEEKPIGMFKSDCGNFGYSPDGLINDDGLIEIKNLEAEAHSNVLLNPVLPNDYKCQIQGGLWISGRKWLDFVAFNRFCKIPEKQLIIIRVKRDEVFISELAKLAQKTIAIRDEILKQIRGSK
jgi:exodeoxyribonuclease (lambda-induced)